MRITRQHKVYLAVLGLAVGALVLDRAVLGTRLTGPADASAFVPEPDDPLHTPAPRSTGRSLASRISQAAEAGSVNAEGVVDAFAPLRKGPGQAAEPSGPAAEFLANHRISAVMVKPSGAAIIDGACVRVGDPVSGYVLRAVEQDTITLEHLGQSVVIDVSIVPKAGESVRVSSPKPDGTPEKPGQ